MVTFPVNKLLSRLNLRSQYFLDTAEDLNVSHFWLCVDSFRESAILAKKYGVSRMDFAGSIARKNLMPMCLPNLR